MSKAKEIILKVKAMFDAPVMPPAADPAAPAGVDQPFKLQDGTEITINIEDPAVSMVPDAGDMVMIAGAPAPAGDYILEDGTTFTTDATGAITVITAAAPVTDPAAMAAPPAEPAAAAPGKSIEERLAAIEAELAKMKMAATPGPVTDMATTSQLQAVEATIAKYGKVIEGQFELLELLTAEPTADPATKTTPKKEVSDKMVAREAKFKAMADAFADSKKKNINPVTA